MAPASEGGRQRAAAAAAARVLSRARSRAGCPSSPPESLVHEIEEEPEEDEIAEEIIWCARLGRGTRLEMLAVLEQEQPTELVRDGNAVHVIVEAMLDRPVGSQNWWICFTTEK